MFVALLLLTQTPQTRIVCYPHKIEVTVPHNEDDYETVAINYYDDMKVIGAYPVLKKGVSTKIADTPDWDTSTRSPNERIRVQYLTKTLVKVTIPKGYFNDHFVIEIHPTKKEVSFRQKGKEEKLNDETVIKGEQGDK